MKLYNTRDRYELVNFKEALFRGIGEGGGLYLPVEIPLLPGSIINNGRLNFNELCYEVATSFLTDEIPPQGLHDLIAGAINFDAPLVSLNDDIKILELFHGPTLAFKDFGARFMAGAFSYFIGNENEEITILVATSGDTGSAVANAFHGMAGIKVVLLYPSGRVSQLQEKQFSTLGGNITALEISGTFDDCQSLVKKAFSDAAITGKKKLSSANSINIARLIPQTFYYFGAYGRLENKNKPFLFCVPSGNLGNLTAGLMSKKMGLPVSRFISAVNANTVFSDYISSGDFKPAPSISTLSNAMDVGSPNNFERITGLFDNSYEYIRNEILSTSVSDTETIGTIKKVYSEFNYILDPHGAVGYAAMQRLLDTEGTTKILLETAHPAKFGQVIESAIGRLPDMPDRLKASLEKEKQSIELPADYPVFKEFLMYN